MATLLERVKAAKAASATAAPVVQPGAAPKSALPKAPTTVPSSGSLLERVKAAKAAAPAPVAPAPALPASTSPNIKRLPPFLGGGEYDLASLQSKEWPDQSTRSYPMKTQPGQQRDHNIPFSLGGTNTKKNVFLVPLERAQKRDAYISDLDRQVRAGKLSKQEAFVKATAFYDSMDQPSLAESTFAEAGRIVDEGAQKVIHAAGSAIKDRIAKAKEYFAPSAEGVRARDVLREGVNTVVKGNTDKLNVVKKGANIVYDAVSSLILPGVTPEEARSPKFLLDTAKALPKAAGTVVSTAVAHPVQTALDIVRGTAKGLTRTITGITLNLAEKDPAIRQEAKNIIEEKMSKLLGDSDSAFSQGFEMAGAAAPVIAAGGILGEVGGTVASRVAGAKAGQAAGAVGNVAGFTGTGQLMLDREASIDERATQFTKDLAALGFLHLGTKAVKSVKNQAKAAMKGREVAHASARLMAEEASNIIAEKPNATPAEIAASVQAKAKEFNANITKQNKTLPLNQRWPTMSEADISKLASKVADSAQKLPNASKPFGFEETVKNTPGTAPEVAAALKGKYEPITNQATIDEVTAMYKANPESVVELAHSDVPTAKSNVAAQLLITEYQKAGRFTDAINLVERTAAEATKQGQAIQALSIYGRLTPDGVARFTQKLINDANKKVSKARQVKLTPELMEKIRKQAEVVQSTPEGSRERAVETGKLLRDIQEPIPATRGQQVAAFQTMAQLLNPKTAIRNLIGNAGFQAIENVKDVVATGVDKAVSVVTGQRTKVLPSLKTQAKGMATGFKEGAQDARLGIDTRPDLQGRLTIPKAGVFKGKVGKALETMLNVELRASDRAFYQSAFEESLRQQKKAAALSKDGKVPSMEQMVETANADALYRTFQDNSVPARAFSGLKKVLNGGKDFGLGDFVIKYPKTPGSILSRGIAYSPAGFIRTVMELAKPVIGKSFDQRAFVESFSRATVGSAGLIGTGAILHRVGIITGKSNDPKDVKGVEKESGLGDYKINVSALKRFVLSGFNADAAKMEEGDKLVSYDWFQPAAIGISMGAAIDDKEAANKGKVAELTNMVLKNPKGPEARQIRRLTSLSSSALEGIFAGTDTLTEQPVVQGVKRLAGAQNVGKGVLDTLRGVPASFVPTFLNQLRQLIDNASRNVDDENFFKGAAKQVALRIPGASKALPVNVGTFGKDRETFQDASNTVFNVFFNPSFVSKYKPTPEAKIVLDLYNKTGDTSPVPAPAPDKLKINGEDVTLSAEERANYQRLVGTFSAQRINAIAKQPAFLKLDDEKKANTLGNVLADIGTAARIVMFGHKPKLPSQRVKDYVAEMRKLSTPSE